MLGVPLKEIIRMPSLAPTARAQSLLTFGLIYRNRLPVSEMERTSREALALFHGSGDEPGEADARDLLGDVLCSKGQLGEALREYQTYQQIMQRLTQHDPDNTGWQCDLSVSYNNVGRIYQAQGQLGEALREYQAGKQIMQRLTQHDPDNTGWQCDLSVSYNNVGSIYEAQGQLGEALREYQADLIIAERLAAQAPDNKGWQSELEITKVCVSRVQSLRTTSTIKPEHG